MRIGFIGAGGTGKTTTAKAVAAKLGLEFRPSVARRVYERHGLTERTYQEKDPEFKLKFQLECFEEREKDEATWPTDVISDRTLIDQFCYNMQYCAPLMSKELVRDLVRRALNRVQCLDYVVCFPFATFPGQDDGMRIQSYGQRLQLHLLIRGFLAAKSRHLPRLKFIPMGSIGERVEWVAGLAKRDPHFTS